MKRLPSRELLDDDAGTPAEIADSLQDIRFVNHYLGGLKTALHMMRQIARSSRRSEFSLLEIAAGSGELPQTVSARLKQYGIDLRFTLLDRCANHMCAPGSKVAADALALPFRDNSFDLVSCCLFVHHLSPEQVALFLAEALRCSCVAVLVNDLIRHPVHYATACAGRLIYRSRISRNDAPASVRQAYTTKEMRELLQHPDVERVDITRHFFYRMGAIVWKRTEI